VKENLLNNKIRKEIDFWNEKPYASIWSRGGIIDLHSRILCRQKLEPKQNGVRGWGLGECKSYSLHIETRKMVNYAMVERSQGKP